MKEATIKDIAEVAGCSKNTVSLALRGSSRISPARRDEIEAIALSLGYVANLSARHLSAKQSPFIGIFTQTIRDAVRMTLIDKLITGFHGTGLHPIFGLGDSAEQQWQHSPWIEAYRAMRVQAIVLVGEAPGLKLHPGPRKVPMVLVHCQPDEHLECDYIGLDRAEAAFLGKNRLEEHGRRSIVVFGSRGSTFTQSVAESGTPSCSVSICCVDIGEPKAMAGECFSHFLSQRGVYDGALFQDSGVAAEFLNMAVLKGIPIPEELAIVAYDYYPQADLLKVGLSTIEQPLDELAERAIEIIVRRAHHPEAPWVHETLPHRLALRESG